MTGLAIFSVVAGFYTIPSDDSSVLSGDGHPPDGDGWDCDTCTPTPCGPKCNVPSWLEHVKCHTHLKENRISHLSCDDVNPCHSCRGQLALDASGSFRRRVRLLRKDRDAKRKKRKEKRRSTPLSTLRPHSGYETDTCEFTVQVSLRPHVYSHLSLSFLSSDNPADLNLQGEYEDRAKKYLQRLKAEQERAERKRNKPSTSAAAAQNSVSFSLRNLRACLYWLVFRWRTPSLAPWSHS